MACLVMLFEQQFSLFKQYNIYFYNIFTPHLFLQHLKNVTSTALPSQPLFFKIFSHLVHLQWANDSIFMCSMPPTFLFISWWMFVIKSQKHIFFLVFFFFFFLEKDIFYFFKLKHIFEKGSVPLNPPYPSHFHFVFYY